MDRIIDQVADYWNTNGTLVDSASSAELTCLAQAPEVCAAHVRLNKDAISLAELATDTARGKVSEVCIRGRWGAVLIKDYLVNDDIVVSPYPTMLMPLDGTVIKVKSYAVAPEVFSRSRVPEADTPKLVDDRSIAFGSAWATPAAGVCPSIYEASEGAVILAISGPTYAPYTHVFDAGLRYSGSSFSSEVYTGRVFFSDLMKHSTRSDLQRHLSPVEADRIRDYIHETVLRPDSMSEEVWPLVQSLSSLDPSAAVGLLRKLGSSGHELAHSAKSTLLANGIDPDV